MATEEKTWPLKKSIFLSLLRPYIFIIDNYTFKKQKRN